MDLTNESQQIVEQEGLVIYPTETAYAIGGKALSEEVIDLVYEAKDRARSKGLTVIVDSLETAEEYAELDGAERALVEEFMAKPLTQVADKDNEYRIIGETLDIALGNAAMIVERGLKKLNETSLLSFKTLIF